MLLEAMQANHSGPASIRKFVSWAALLQPLRIELARGKPSPCSLLRRRAGNVLILVPLNKMRSDRPRRT